MMSINVCDGSERTNQQRKRRRRRRNQAGLTLIEILVVVTILGIIAGILVARHLNTTDDLFDNRSSPRTEAMVAAAVQWAERIMKKVDNVFGNAGAKL